MPARIALRSVVAALVAAALAAAWGGVEQLRGEKEAASYLAGFASVVAALLPPVLTITRPARAPFRALLALGVACYVLPILAWSGGELVRGALGGRPLLESWDVVLRVTYANATPSRPIFYLYCGVPLGYLVVLALRDPAAPRTPWWAQAVLVWLASTLGSALWSRAFGLYYNLNAFAPAIACLPIALAAADRVDARVVDAWARHARSG